MTAPEPRITKYVKKKEKKEKSAVRNPIGYPNPTPLSPLKPLTELKALNVVLLGVV